MRRPKWIIFCMPSIELYYVKSLIGQFKKIPICKCMEYSSILGSQKIIHLWRPITYLELYVDEAMLKKVIEKIAPKVI